MNPNKILIPLLFLTLALGQLQRLPGGLIYAHDLIIILLLLLNYSQLKFSRPWLIFVLSAIFSLFLAAFKLPFPNILLASLYLFRFISYTALISLSINWQWLLYLSTSIAGLGLVQYAFIPDTRFLAQLGWDDHYYRLISVLFDPNFTGLILVLGLILIYFNRPRSWWLYAIHLLALLLTYSRSSYLALLAAGLYLAIVNKKLKFFLLGFSALCLVLFLLPRPGGDGVKLERTFSIIQRWENYQAGFKLWQQPIFGLGFNTLRYYNQDYLSHASAGQDSSLLFVAVTTGLVGLTAYLFWLKSIFSRSLVLKVSLVAILIHSLFQNSLFYPWVLIWFTVLAGI
ncbi:MAG: O-antigen ligase family protein [Patescibacteria group bacterium]